MSGNQYASVFELDSSQLIVDLDIWIRILKTWWMGWMGEIFAMLLNGLVEQRTRMECVGSPFPEIGDKREVVIKSLICNLQVFKC